MLTVRPRTDHDFDQLEAVLHDCHAKTGYPLEGLKDARAFINDVEGELKQAWVAEHEGKIVGHIAVNAADDSCPAVSLWRQRPDGQGRVAVGGRLFVHPAATGKTLGVTKALADAVTTWSRENETRIIMYVVTWSAVRAYMAASITARFGYEKYGETVYHSSDGWSKPAVCYAQGLESLHPERAKTRETERQSAHSGLTKTLRQLTSLTWMIWNDPKFVLRMAYVRYSPQAPKWRLLSLVGA